MPYAILIINDDNKVKEINFIYIFPKYNKEDEYSISVDKTLEFPYNLEIHKNDIPFIIDLLNTKDNFVKNRSLK